MQSRTWLRVASAILLAGGLSWVVKIGVIVATDGRIITSGPAAFLMSAGLILLPVGAGLLGAWLARRSHVALRVLAALGAVGLLVACSVGLGMIGASMFRGREPWYAAEEAGILFAGLLWTTVGGVVVASARRARE